MADKGTGQPSTRLIDSNIGRISRKEISPEEGLLDTVFQLAARDYLMARVRLEGVEKESVTPRQATSLKRDVAECREMFEGMQTLTLLDGIANQYIEGGKTSVDILADFGNFTRPGSEVRESVRELAKEEIANEPDFWAFSNDIDDLREPTAAELKAIEKEADKPERTAWSPDKAEKNDKPAPNREDRTTQSDIDR